MTAPSSLLRGLDRDTLAQVLGSLTASELRALASEVAPDLLAPFARYRTDAAAFLTEVLHETAWTKQVEVLDAIAHNNRVAVPASHSVSKTHTAARVAAWWVTIHPPGTVLVLTTAPTFRQVRNVLWPHIRRLIERHNLPGEANLTEWKVGGELVAFGFSAADNDEAAVQGFHQANLLAIVDEAGGIGHLLGNALEGLMTGGNTKLLLIGNPPTDEEGSWFEKSCNDPDYTVVRIAAADSPNMTGEQTGPCQACPPQVPPHPLATHLVDQEWVDRQVRLFGPDSPFVQARVHARFVANVSDRVIPWGWVERACHEDPQEPGKIRLGVDIAADGGDEFVVAKADGNNLSILHTSSGSANASQVNVAGKVWQLARAELDAGASEVTVRVDAIGIGRGTSDLLTEWAREREPRRVRIVGVNVAQKAGKPDEFKNQRAEMWWTMRQALSPDAQTLLRLDIDDLTSAQLAGPRYSSDSQGRIVVESKDAMKRRGLSSPDRAEALLLALYVPPGGPPPLVAPLGMGQANQWGAM